ncbi:MAG TPA: hypothetical protein VFG66_08575 [Gemmatimonadales bacterium]|nr:hypothetical protein [Gemmatimonadales bacterium]
MKQLAIGCAVLLGLGIAGGAAASYLTYRKVTSTFAGFAEIGTLPELERSVRKQGSYTPPASGEPSRAQVEQVLAVQQAVRARLGTRADEFDHRYRRLLAQDRATAADLPDLVSAYRDLAAAYVHGKRAQVDALNRAGLSLEEYRWTRAQMYAALGMPLMDIDVSRMIEDVKAGRQPETPVYQMTVAPTGSPVVQRLVEAHRRALEANAGLAIFGL